MSINIKDLPIEDKFALYREKKLLNGCVLCNNVTPLPDEYTPLTKQDIVDGLIDESIDCLDLDVIQGADIKKYMGVILDQLKRMQEMACDERQGFMNDIIITAEHFAAFEIAYEKTFVVNEDVIETTGFQNFVVDVANYYMIEDFHNLPILILYLMYHHVKMQETNKDVYIYLCMLLQLFYYHELFIDEEVGTGEHIWWETRAPRSIDLELMNWLSNTKWSQGRLVYEGMNYNQLAFRFYVGGENRTLTLQDEDDYPIFKTSKQLFHEKEEKQDEEDEEEEEDGRSKKKQRVSKEVIVIDDDDISEADTVVEKKPKTVLYHSVIRDIIEKYA